jgi:hypothetical protein
MSSDDLKDLQAEITSLMNENAALRAKAHILQKKVDFFERHQAFQKGVQGESLVAAWADGLATPNNAAYDVTVNSGGTRLEVKFSSLYSPSKISPTLRWAWHTPFGESGSKHYDRLILIGESDERYAALYTDSGSPYVIFDVPFDEVMPLTVARRATRSIFLTSNPRKAHSRAARLFKEYQRTESEIKARYESLEPPHQLPTTEPSTSIGDAPPT